MSWFKRAKEGISTSTKDKKATPEGLWYKCPRCKKTTLTEDHRKNTYVCPHCQYHHKISSGEYFEILFDEGHYKEMDTNMVSGDPLEFFDSKSYKARVEENINKTGLKDAVRTASGKVDGHPLVVACMDFGFIGGSMGSVVGEKISRAIQYSRTHRTPLLVISKSGGARMMEAAHSLMQMAKTSAQLALLAKEGIPYISLMTDPTTGGVTASFAMLGDFNIAEPEALIGFAGPRVIKETIGKDLPKGFQSSEFLLEHGFIDFIVPRPGLKTKMALLLQLLTEKKSKSKKAVEA
ncbi:MAG TPA: acetyl-CoA carboxylase, carboxyltransferase subunit beta [Bacteroidia bacterium]|nr:acetyl-CoA carboxylase, carboxyltransferase subunit beta [Bacteroidia bacterium]